MSTDKQVFDEDLLTREEVAKRLRISPSTLYRQIESGDIPPPIFITPRRPLWPASRIRALLDAKMEEAGYEV